MQEVTQVPADEGGRVAGGVYLPRDWASVRELRIARGLSQLRLAELSGVSERTVRAIERGAVGRPQHESLRRIAAVLAYGESHGQRLVERWTGVSVDRSPDEIGIPDWQALYQRIGARRPEDGGQMSSVICDITVGADRRVWSKRFLEVHERMSPSGPPTVWQMTSGLPADVSAVRFEVAAGGVVDDFVVMGEVAALAVRPDPAVAQRGPFLVEFSVDFSATDRAELQVEHEWMFGSLAPLRLAGMIVRFSGTPPVRLWAAQGETAATLTRRHPLPIGSDGAVHLMLYDVLGVFGVQWEWGDADDGGSPGPGASHGPDATRSGA